MATRKKTARASKNEVGSTPRAAVSATSKAVRPATAKPAKVAGIQETFVVQSQGYKETFTDRTAAKQQFETLKKRSIKNKQTAKISLSAKHIDDDKDVVLEELKIDKSFFDDED